MVLYLTLGENYHENSRWQWHFRDLNGRQDSGNQIQELQRAPKKDKASSAEIRQCMGSSRLITNVTLLFTDQNDPSSEDSGFFLLGQKNLAPNAFKPHFLCFHPILKQPICVFSLGRKNFSTRSKENKRKMVRGWMLPFSWAISCRQK